MTGGGLTPLPTADDDDQHQQFKGVSRILGPRWAHLPTITIGLLGVQIFWSVEMSYASPYLLSLGLSKSSMAGVFVAGPLSGLLMQPLIGVLADNSTSRFGRRRPYMLLGSTICVTAMLLLGFTRPFAAIFTGWNNNALSGEASLILQPLMSFLVQAVDRALVVDTLPTAQQAAGNAWAARMLGIGSVVGFFVGNIDLPDMLPFLGKTQLEVLAVIVSFLLLAVHLLMAWAVKERVLLKSTSPEGKARRKTFSQEMKDIWVNMRTLPRVIRQIVSCAYGSTILSLTLSSAWIAWFPVLFYSTLYIGDIYKRSSPLPSDSTNQQIELHDAEGNRLGARALFFSALLSLFINLVMPLFVAEAAASRSNSRAASPTRERWLDRTFQVPKRLRIHLATLWAVSHFVFASCMFATFFTHSIMGATLIVTITGFSWAITQWAPFSLLAEAILTEPATSNGTADDTESIVLADTRTPSRASRNSRDDMEEGERSAFLPGSASDSEDEDEEGVGRKRKSIDGSGPGRREMEEQRRGVLGNSEAQVSRIDISVRRLSLEDQGEYEIVPGPGQGSGRSGRRRDRSAPGTLSAKAGTIMGIHNIFIVIPQFLVTGFSALLFALFDPKKPALPAHRAPVAPGPVPTGNMTAAAAEVVERGLSWSLEHLVRREGMAVEGNSNTVVYVFRIGGVAASFAFVFCWRLARELRHR
ncbi:hypothetical protein CVT26_013500 [Gymnopilus dilepis]|uniref:Major facilitator superfamily (MFS) profile domain-containing protein n=1 Tax=Gymnopilus dilepis TaxID=231916 RepID=A0A409Y5K7_9AGAR|nr:hypothetical protein CVT26_013500 [Gymnopilus dilepis]